jgi:hypothetical protein
MVKLAVDMPEISAILQKSKNGNSTIIQKTGQAVKKAQKL